MQICECVQKKYTDVGCFADTFIRETALGSCPMHRRYFTLTVFFNLCLKVECYLFASAPTLCNDNNVEATIKHSSLKRVGPQLHMKKTSL